MSDGSSGSVTRNISSSNQIRNGREWLQHEFSIRKSRNKHFSLRAFARLLDISYGHLSDLMRGKQLLSDRILSKVATLSELTEAEKIRLTSVVRHASGRCETLFFGVPPLMHEAHVRRPQLDRVQHEWLHPGTRYAIFGPVGVGKTHEIRRRLSDETFRNQFADGVVWFNLATDESNFERLGVVCEALGIPSSRRELKSLEDRRSFLANRFANSRSLFVFDHVTSWEELESLQIGGEHSTFLLMTRSAELAARFAPEANVRLEHFSRSEALECVHHLVPKIPSRFESKIEQILHRVDYCPALVSALALFWKRSFRENVERRLDTALRASEELLRSTPWQKEIAPSLTQEIQAVLGLHHKELAQELRKVIGSLTLFAPAPSSFSQEAACAVGNCDVEVIAELITSGYLHSLDDGSICVSTGTRYALSQDFSDIEAMKRFLSYYLSLVQRPELRRDAVVRERRNLLAAFDLALGLKDIKAVVCFARTVFLEMRAFHGDDWEVAAFEKIERLLQSKTEPELLVDFLLAKGDGLFERGFAKLALHAYEKAYATATSAQYAVGELEAALAMALSIQNVPERERWIALLRERLPFAPKNDLYCRILRVVGRHLIESGLVRDGQLLLLQGLHLAQTLNLTRRVAELSEYLSVSYCFLGDFDTAIQMALESQQQLLALHDFDKLLHIQWHLATFYMTLGDLPLLVPLLHNILTLAQKQALPLFEIRANYLLSIALFYSGKIPDALDCASKAWPQTEKLGNPTLTCLMARAMHLPLMRLRRDREALIYFGRGVEAAQFCPPAMCTNLYLDRAEEFLTRCDWENLTQALTDLERIFADGAAQTLSIQRLIIDAHRSLAMGDGARAAKYLADIDARDVNDKLPLEKADRDWLAAKISHFQGDEQNARDHAERALAFFQPKGFELATEIAAWIANPSGSSNVTERV